MEILYLNLLLNGFSLIKISGYIDPGSATAIMAMIIFDEKFMIYHIWGAIFIIAGITLSNKKN